MKEWRDDWCPYFAKEGDDNCFEFKPFPYVLGYGVVTPHGFEVNNNHKNLVIALEKLKILILMYARMFAESCNTLSEEIN